MIDYESLEKEYEEVKKEREKAREKLELLEEQTKNLRIKETANVLEYIAHLAESKEPTKELLNDIERYAVHCLNCLNGNIDGTFLPIWQERQPDNGYKVMYGEKTK